MHIKLGVDVGNFDIKTEHTSTPSGFSIYHTEPQLTKDYLFYNDVWYVPSISERIEYIQDKTENDLCLIFTFIGIAKELIYCAKQNMQKMGFDFTARNLQRELDNVTSISLGVGLPVGDIEKLKVKTQNYYKEKLKNGVSFMYSGYKFSFTVKSVQVFPQDLLAVVSNPVCTIPKEYSSYAIIGIGGQTVDVIPVEDGKPVVENCFSDRRGVRALFTSCVSVIEREFGKTVKENTIDQVLNHKKTLLSEEMISVIHEQAYLHVQSLLNYCQMKHSLQFADTPIVFFGGGSLLLEGEIKKFDIPAYEFVRDVNGNARYYAKFVA